MQRYLASLGSLDGGHSPAVHGLASWAYDPVAANSGSAVTNGTVYLTKVYVATTVTITRLLWAVSTVGATPTSSQNFVGLYDSAGTRLATAGVDADITTATVKSTTISSQALTGGAYYWVAFVFNAGTPPTLARAVGGNVASSLTNVGLTAGAYAFAVNGTSQTSLPSSITPGSNLQGTSYWAAVGV